MFSQDSRYRLCVTPDNDGCKPRKTADLAEFYTGQKEIYLLDQNLLACKERIDLIRQLAASGAKVDFSGGLDIRYMTDEVIEERVSKAAWEISQAEKYDYVIVNDALEDAISDFFAVIRGEQLKVDYSGDIINEVLKNA